MAHPINVTGLQDGEKLQKLVAMKRSLSEHIRKWMEDEVTPIVDDGLTALDTYLGEDTCDLMAQSAMNILLAQKTLTEYLRSEGHDDI